MTSRSPRKITFRRGRHGTKRRGILFLVALAVVGVLALIGVSFAFWMRADLASVEAVEKQQQALRAAESAIERTALILRTDRFNVDNWYDNPESFRRIPIWMEGSEDADLGSLADQEMEEGVRAWRFSVVGYKRDGEDAEIRYGIIDEGSKININTASREQLLAFFDQFEYENVTSPELADAIIDWRDEDDKPNSAYGAESNYYFRLNPRYRAKNRYFDTVEELLMVKGFNSNGQILYGEDYNRNGYLDENEDDGPEGAFPPDDGDGVLLQGVYPFLTVYSWDWNTSNDNKPRVNINAVSFAETDGTDIPGTEAPEEGEDPEVPAEGEEENPLAGFEEKLGKLAASQSGIPEHIYDEVRPEVIEFIAEAQKRGYQFRSIGELIGLEVFEDGSSNTDRMWRQYYRQRREGEKQRMSDVEDEEGAFDDERAGSDREDDESDSGEEGGDGDEQGDEFEDGPDENEDPFDRDEDDEEEKDDRRSQSVREEDAGVTNDGQDDIVVGNPDEVDSDDGEGDPDDTANKGTPIISPVTAEDMPVLIDRLTALNAPAIPGQINVNTASELVLRTVPGLEEDDVSAIIASREQLSGEEKETTAWLVTQGALEPEKYALVSNALTTRSIQFTIDAVGFADHEGTFKRIQAVIEMRGPIAQTKYYRDISNLGIGYPVRDDERSEGFAFSD